MISLIIFGPGVRFSSSMICIYMMQTARYALSINLANLYHKPISMASFFTGVDTKICFVQTDPEGRDRSGRFFHLQLFL
jgi:hypothetical protein